MILPNYLRNSSPWLSDFSRLFDTALQRSSQAPRNFRIHEADDRWTLSADFPGKTRENLDLEFRDGALHLGIKSENETANSYRLPLGKHIDPSGISANLETGVLTVTLPKAKAANDTHRIEIN